MARQMRLDETAKFFADALPAVGAFENLPVYMLTSTRHPWSVMTVSEP